MRGGSQSGDQDEKLLTDRELSKILKDNGQADYVTRFSGGAFNASSPLEFNTRGAGGDWNGALLDWRQQNPSLLTPVVPKVEIIGTMPTYLEWMANKFKTSPEVMAERLGSGNDPLYDFKVSQRGFYRDAEANASNRVSREFWHMAGLASKAGNNFGAAGYGLYRIATNGDARSSAAASLAHTWDNLPRIMEGQVDQFKRMSGRELVDAGISFGLESATMWGAGKVVGITGEFALDAGKATFKYAMPKLGAFGKSAAYSFGEVLTEIYLGERASPLAKLGLFDPFANFKPLFAIPPGKRLSDNIFADILRREVGLPPADMFDPHAHHILFKKGLGEAQQELVNEGQAILRRFDIDPVYGKENLVWAPMRVAGQHGANVKSGVCQS